MIFNPPQFFKSVFIPVVIVLLGGTIFLFKISNAVQEYGREQFERGAWATQMCHKYFGNYGNSEYRTAVFESFKDPQDSLEVLGYLPAELDTTIKDTIILCDSDYVKIKETK
jgi:hypothetical protein